MVDADRQDPTWFEHLFHQPEPGVHELHPLGVLRPVIGRDDVADPRVVGVLVPLVVVAEVVPGVVRGIRQNQIDVATLAVQGDQCLEVVSLDQEIARPIRVRSGAVLLHGPLDVRADLAGDPPRQRLARERQLDPGLSALLQHRDELVLAEQFQVVEIVHFILVVVAVVIEARYLFTSVHLSQTPCTDSHGPPARRSIATVIVSATGSDLRWRACDRRADASRMFRGWRARSPVLFSRTRLSLFHAAAAGGVAYGSTRNPINCLRSHLGTTDERIQASRLERHGQRNQVRAGHRRSHGCDVSAYPDGPHPHWVRPVRMPARSLKGKVFGSHS